jgi:hypothetical protein
MWAKNILGSSLMMAHHGHMGQTGYRNVRHGAYLYEHPNTRAVVSLIKARIIYSKRTTKRNPIKPKLAKSTHLDK